MNDCTMCATDTGPHPTGSTFRREPCGCEVAGMGLLPNPWHVHYCTAHAAVQELLKLAEFILRPEHASADPEALISEYEQLARSAIAKAGGLP